MVRVSCQTKTMKSRRTAAVVLPIQIILLLHAQALAQAQAQALAQAATPANANANAQNEVCSAQLLQTCAPCWSTIQNQNQTETGNDDNHHKVYDCNRPGLVHLQPGKYQGVTVNYLSYLTQTSSPTFPLRAQELEACTGGRILFSEASNAWADPIADLGTATSRGSELYDGYFMSYAHFPEASSLGLAETLNERIRQSSDQLNWQDIFPKVKTMGEYRKNGVTNIDFLMYDGDFFVPIVRLDLLQKHQFSIPNTWDELVQLAQFFNGTDINDDGDPNDLGICFFPGQGGGSWDWFFPEYLYAVWATFDQTHGAQQGFFFQDDTLEPRIGKGFAQAAQIWKHLWDAGTTDCGTDMFQQGRCALGFAPPGCWKSVFLNGVARKDENHTIIWQPTMQSGEYAEPYRLKPFGSLEVIDRSKGNFVTCASVTCPKAERVPSHGLVANDRASILPPSPHEGKLINRAPFFWSGGLGTLIRKSAPQIKKDLLWDFFVYTNSPDTSVQDITKASWLDSWRFSHLLPGDNFLAGGWSKQAYEEHKAVMLWALSSESTNSAFNIRLPGGVRYTRDAVGKNFAAYRQGELSLDDFVKEVEMSWRDITDQQGKLDQLDTYRASLGKDSLSQVDLCRLHRNLMDKRDPSVCRKYDDPETSSPFLLVVAPSLAFVVAVLAAVLCFVRRRKASNDVWLIKRSELHFSNPPEILGSGTFGHVFLAEYRGTQVAVKRVIPPQTSGSGGGNVAKRSAMPLASGISLVASRRDFTRDSFQDVEEAEFARKSSTSTFRVYPESQKLDSAPLEPNDLVASEQHLTRGSFGDESSFGNNRTGKSRDKEYEKLKQEFLLEMRQLAKLRHPCITTIMGAVLERNHEPWLVMELMEKGSLYNLLHDETFTLDGEIVLPILRDVAQGVRFLHAADPQIVHSDLKASNILVDGRFRAKVADFGLSQNRSGGAAGTPFWLAPEVLRRESGNTPESDAYAFGMILYEIFSRKDPYDGEHPAEVLMLVADKFINKRPPIPSACPPKARILMTDCLDGDSSKRPTFEELDLQLRRIDPEAMAPLVDQDDQENQKKVRTEGGLSALHETSS